ncbi:MAG TPA: hypothetical protein VGG27_13855 [Magnetospirillaceae bacterium]|jgi:hypothetical protein
MDFDSFRKSVSANAPPKDLELALQALWWDAKGDWDKAHEIADKRHDADGSWVHAYLHRKEGDRGNAGYWYRHAGKAMPSKTSLDDEWTEIAKALTHR